MKAMGLRMQMRYYANIIASSTHKKLARTLFVLTVTKSDRLKFRLIISAVQLPVNSVKKFCLTILDTDSAIAGMTSLGSRVLFFLLYFFHNKVPYTSTWRKCKSNFWKCNQNICFLTEIVKYSNWKSTGTTITLSKGKKKLSKYSPINIFHQCKQDMLWILIRFIFPLRSYGGKKKQHSSWEPYITSRPITNISNWWNCANQVKFVTCRHVALSRI